MTALLSTYALIDRMSLMLPPRSTKVFQLILAIPCQSLERHWSPTGDRSKGKATPTHTQTHEHTRTHVHTLTHVSYHHGLCSALLGSAFWLGSARLGSALLGSVRLCSASHWSINSSVPHSALTPCLAPFK